MALQKMKINSGEYQVHVYGHSCGFSDRTMLKESFNQETGISIEL